MEWVTASGFRSISQLVKVGDLAVALIPMGILQGGPSLVTGGQLRAAPWAALARRMARLVARLVVRLVASVRWARGAALFCSGLDVGLSGLLEGLQFNGS